MPDFRAASSLRSAPLALLLAACLNACLLDPDPGPGPQASRTSQGPAPEARPAGPVVAIRAALPPDAIGKVDSAELRMRTAAGKVSAYPMAVSDSAVAAEIRTAEPGEAEFEVAAFASGQMAYSGSFSLDPARAGAATVAIALGGTGRVRIEAVFAGGGME